MAFSLSNGPGDPEPCTYAIEATKVFLEKGLPIFGICLGHQILALASGAQTVKMKFGHHGANHPVKDLERNVVMITSQTTVLQQMKQRYQKIYVLLTYRYLMALFKVFTAQISLHLASKVTLKQAQAHMMRRHYLTTSSN